LSAATRRHLRPFDISRDLNPVADLIEVCFADSLDIDGQRYLRQMRSAARNPRLLRWAASLSEHASLPLTGYVWEEDGRVVGNLSLIPLTDQGKRIYLIANVAVDAGYRRRGIARSLTTAALDLLARRRGVTAVWLQVREENAAAHHLYTSLGFGERARRTAWQRRQEYWPPGALPHVKVRPRRARHWSQQRAWLDRLYPLSLSWNIPLNRNILRPGLRGAFYRFFTATQVRQWSAEENGRLLGVLAWQPLGSYNDRLWLATPPEGEELAVRALLGNIEPAFPRHRLLTLDFPSGRGSQALDSVGFIPHQTLIWMRLPLV
jgi:GNAT superfamily N-acetyltransferase